MGINLVVNVNDFSPKDDVHNLQNHGMEITTNPATQYNTIKQYILSYVFLFYNTTCLAYPCV